MTKPLPLSAQIRTVETVRNVIKRGDSLRSSERELMEKRLNAVEQTLRWLARHENTIRAGISEADT